MNNLFLILGFWASCAFLTSCATYKNMNPHNTVAVGYSENGSYLNTGYYTGYAYDEPRNWYGVTTPVTFNNSLWYAH